MLSILSHYWGWLVLFFVIGFLAALMAFSDADDEEASDAEVKLSDEANRRRLPLWFFPLAGLAVLGVIASLFGFVDDITGAWITTGALAFAAFSGGAIAGAFGGVSGLRWGPLLVAGLVWACSLFITPPSAWFPAEKAPAAAEAPAAAPAVKAAEDAAKAVAAKAEEEAKAVKAKAEEAAKAAAAKAEAETKAAALKAEEEAKAVAAKAEEAAKAAAAKAEEDAKEAAAKAEEEAKEAAAKAAAAAPVSVKKLAELKASAIAAAKALPATGPLDLGQCQTALSGLIAKENVKFDTGSAKVSKASLALIAKIGATLGRCPGSVSVEVSGHTDSSGDAAKNKALSQSRAEAVVDLLKAKGAKADQLTAVGYGPEKPLASNDTNDGKAANRRIEFAVK